MNSFEKIWYLISNYGTTFLEGLVATLILALFGTFVGLLLGIIFALIKDIKIKEDDNKVVIFFKKLLKGFISLYVNVFRGTPMMVQAMIIYFGTDVIFNWSKIESFSFFTGAFWCGLFVITINTGAYMTEIVRSGLNGVDKGQWEACETLGLSKWQTMKLVILPQAFKRIIPPVISEFITLIKDSSLISCIGAVELLKGAQVLGAEYFDVMSPYCLSAVFYLIMTLSISYLGRYIEGKLAASD